MGRYLKYPRIIFGNILKMEKVSSKGKSIAWHNFDPIGRHFSCNTIFFLPHILYLYDVSICLRFSCDLLYVYSYLLPGKIVWEGRGPGKTCLSLRGAGHPRLPEDCMMLMMLVVGGDDDECAEC